MPKNGAEKVKTTLFLSEEDRETVRRSGKTVEHFFGELMSLYRLLTMDRWSEGVFYHGYIRVCFLRAENLNFLIENLKIEDLRSVGRKVGEKTFPVAKHYLGWDSRDPKNRQRFVQAFNMVLGWGRLQSGDHMIVVEKPIINKPEFLMGYLEAVLNLDLEWVEAYPDRQVFLIKDEKTKGTPQANHPST